MYCYYIGSTWIFYEQKTALLEKYVFKTAAQAILAYVIIYWMIPQLLNKGKRLLFGLSCLTGVYLTYVSYTCYRFYLFDPRYPALYKKFDLADRLLEFNLYFSEITWFIFPAVILIAWQYYEDQQEVLSLREQKKTTELNLLKNQLNPHFLFNTLNNLYSLALQKSDRTPEVIGKLSSILDYMLYHCNENFVSLSDEIALLNNYIELEQVRYGKRVSVNFDYKIGKGIRIAPLMMLTLVENAFKHGVQEELGIASIDIQLQAKGDELLFKVKNSVPSHKSDANHAVKNNIGLENTRKQLAILYSNRHTLVIENEGNYYSVSLTLQQNAL